MQPILIAPDKFKGTYSARAVAGAIVAGAGEVGWPTSELPLADGGEGTSAALLHACEGQWLTATVADPLGRPVEARFAMLGRGERAVVEVAEASGLGRVALHERDAFAASTRGTGELILAAQAAGAREVLLAAGGSATTDGGAGAIAALRDAGRTPRIRVLCDVHTPWEDAPRLFARQKGADLATVSRLEGRLARLAAEAPRDPRGIPMTGAAGGLSGGLWAHFGAELVPGAPFVLDLVGFDAKASAAALVVTGEGSLDEQTFQGKLVYELAKRCSDVHVTCIAVVGQCGIPAKRWRELGLARVIEASTAEQLQRVGRELALGVVEARLQSRA